MENRSFTGLFYCLSGEEDPGGPDLAGVRPPFFLYEESSKVNL